MLTFSMISAMVLSFVRFYDYEILGLDYFMNFAFVLINFSFSFDFFFLPRFPTCLISGPAFSLIVFYLNDSLELSGETFGGRPLRFFNSVVYGTSSASLFGVDLGLFAFISIVF